MPENDKETTGVQTVAQKTGTTCATATITKQNLFQRLVALTNTRLNFQNTIPKTHPGDIIHIEKLTGVHHHSDSGYSYT